MMMSRLAKKSRTLSPIPQGVGDKVRDFLASRDIIIYGGDRQRLVAHLDINQNHLQKVIDGYRDFFA